MAKGKSNSSYEKEYQRARKNYLERVRYQRKKGIFVQEENIPTLKELKKRGESVQEIKRKTARLKQRKAEDITRNKEYEIDPETGEILKQYDPDTGEVIYDANAVADVSILDQIRERLEKLPNEIIRRRGLHTDLTPKKNALFRVFESTVSEYSATGNLGRLVDYYKANQEEFFDGELVIQYASDEEIVDSAFAQIASYLKGGSALTAEEASNVNDYGESITG